MRYRVHVSSPAADAFNKLPEQVRRVLLEDLIALGAQPVPAQLEASARQPQTSA
jgi:mRNA-degrading endonuclease RelE of RelBE toxin-antitoxin system